MVPDHRWHSVDDARNPVPIWGCRALFRCCIVAGALLTAGVACAQARPEREPWVSRVLIMNVRAPDSLSARAANAVTEELGRSPEWRGWAERPRASDLFYLVPPRVANQVVEDIRGHTPASQMHGYPLLDSDVRLLGLRMRGDAIVEVTASLANGVVEVVASLLGPADSLPPRLLTAASDRDLARAASAVGRALAVDTLLRRTVEASAADARNRRLLDSASGLTRRPPLPRRL